MARYSESMSPDTTSSMFPERPIHPLPKRRLRERLSPEVADSIEYPPSPPTTVFYYPYSSKNDDSDARKIVNRLRSVANGDPGRRLDSEEEDPSRTRRSLVPRSAPSILGNPVRPSPMADQPVQYHVQAPPSTASSVDGYDPFENTNNKKKRKVPDTAMGGHSLNDMGSGIGQTSPSTPSRAVHGDASGGPYHGIGSSSLGISGPGRGRFGRNRSGRSPLSEGSRNSKVRPVRWPLSVPDTSPGIISNAIAKVENVASHQGQENVSLLQLPHHSKPSPVSGQFTFTCESQVPGTVSWPGPLPKSSTMNAHAASATGPGTSRSTKPAWPTGADHRIPPASGVASRATGATPPATSQKKTRRRSRIDEYAKAAAERKRSTQVHNLHHPPKEEDVWICHFCEYEYIFGEKPEALIRQYEIKDRKRRKEEEERRRLLEKAKARGRKGKKGAKAPHKSGGSGQDRVQVQEHATNGHGHAHDHDDDYDDQYQAPTPTWDGDPRDNKSGEDVMRELEDEEASGEGLGEAEPPDTPSDGASGAGSVVAAGASEKNGGSGARGHVVGA